MKYVEKIFWILLVSLAAISALYVIFTLKGLIE